MTLAFVTHLAAWVFYFSLAVLAYSLLVKASNGDDEPKD